MTSSSSSEFPQLLPDASALKSSIISGDLKTCVEETSVSSLGKKKSQKQEGISSASVPQKLNTRSMHLELNAPLGSDQAGGSCNTEQSSQNLTPNYMKWASSLNFLLYDEEGLNLFRKYLEQEDVDRLNMLEFWLACKGLSNQPPDKAHQLVKLIYTHLFLKAQSIKKDLRKAVTQQIMQSKTKSTLLPVTIFDDACKQVERIITEVMYPNFLQSDLYINYIQKMHVLRGEENSDNESGEKSPKSCGGEDNSDNCVSVIHEPLPIVDEDKELSLPLTRDMLITTQKRRLGMKKHPESCSGRYLQYGYGGKYLNPYHSGRRLHHSSYNPVSRQDSELQSLSSDARTDSMSDVSFDDMPSNGKELRSYHKHHLQKHQSSNVILNQNPDSYNIIPRTHRVQDVEKLKGQLDVDLLNKKLEEVARERQKNEDEKLPFDYCSADDILDQHVSRSIRDQTPKGSPSPNRTKSPENWKLPPAHLPINKFSVPISGPTSTRILHPYTGTGPSKRKDKDVCSMFSSDSGNGTDLAEGSENQRYNLAKSKSMPDYSCTADQLQSPDTYMPGFCTRGVSRTWSSSRKTLTDSGVSVISGGHHENPPLQPSHQYKEKFVASWLNESDRIVPNSDVHSAISGERESNSSAKHRNRSSASVGSYNSRAKTGTGDRSMSTMSGMGSTRNNMLPAQPFVADPSMPPLPHPHIDTQLEEARRRLIEEQRDQFKQRHSQSGSSKTFDMHLQQPLKSVAATYATKGSKSIADDVAPSVTTVIYNFRGEEVPYRSTVPGNPITLKQFKEHIPRKGNYRYFFITACEDLDMKQIKEEITDDNQLLPLWKGKVMAHIETVD